MNKKKIKSIELSLLKKDSDIDDNIGKAEYLKKKTVKFNIPPTFFTVYRQKNIIEELVSQMYEDLTEDLSVDADSLGLWVDYDSVILDNAISLNTLKDIGEYGKDDVNPLYEFFKMTIPD